MNAAFWILGIITVASAAAAMMLRNLVHCVLALTITFAGLAAFYLLLNAEFAGLAQLLVYIGAVAILIVFAILLTRSGEPDSAGGRRFSPGAACGLGVSLVVFSFLVWAVRGIRPAAGAMTNAPQAPVKLIGDQLMTRYVLPLEVLGILLTAALIGAVVIAVREPKQK
ncbi:MAG TPA: NADH-quinone oxidoreductase subunit J [Verrucomicrobiae bacterium]|nr:NADH-quinone oxidoreductase subunit J [Verrucomicrobiae bacterium]